MLSSVCHLVCYRGCRRRRCEFVIDRLHLRHRSSYQVRGSIYHAYNFQLTVPSSRIDRLLDPTTSYLCLRYKPQTAMSSTSQQTLYCYFTLLAAQPLLSMHARFYSNVILFILGLAITVLYIICG